MSAVSRGAAALLCMLALLAGCSKPADRMGAAAPVAAQAGHAASDNRRGTLATTRRVDMEVPPEAVSPLFTSTQEACEADAANACVVMASQLSTGPATHADLTLRAAPAGIARILARLHAATGFVGESASSEDLAAPIVDSERQIAMARDYRDSLLALRAKGGNDIKTLMSVNEEIARVQSELETATGDRAHLQQRIDTETLTIAIQSKGERAVAFWQPVGEASHEFGTHLSEATAAVITFLAYVVPWIVVLLPLAWIARWLWRRTRGKLG